MGTVTKESSLERAPFGFPECNSQNDCQEERREGFALAAAWLYSGLSAVENMLKDS